MGGFGLRLQTNLDLNLLTEINTYKEANLPSHSESWVSDRQSRGRNTS